MQDWFKHMARHVSTVLVIQTRSASSCVSSEFAIYRELLLLEELRRFGPQAELARTELCT